MGLVRRGLPVGDLLPVVRVTPECPQRARSRIPQLESLLRTREDQLRRVTEESDPRRKHARDSARKARTAVQEIRRVQRELAQANERAEISRHHVSVAETAQIHSEEVDKVRMKLEA